MEKGASRPVQGIWDAVQDMGSWPKPWAEREGE